MNFVFFLKKKQTNKQTNVAHLPQKEQQTVRTCEGAGLETETEAN